MSRAAEAAMAASYKALKEDFVSNLTGGEIGEINCVTAVAPVSFPFCFAERANFWKVRCCTLVGAAITAVIL
jgi:hypothetical protein